MLEEMVQRPVSHKMANKHIYTRVTHLCVCVCVCMHVCVRAAIPTLRHTLSSSHTTCNHVHIITGTLTNTFTPSFSQPPTHTHEHTIIGQTTLQFISTQAKVFFLSPLVYGDHTNILSSSPVCALGAVISGGGNR